MDKIQLVGVGIFSLGILLIIGYLFYKFFLESTNIPEAIKIALLLIFLGIVVILASLSFERAKELKK